MPPASICIISQYWEPDINGDVTRLRNAIDVLRSLGHRITLITSVPHYPNGDRRGYRFRLFRIEKSEGLTVVRIDMPSIAHSGFGQRMLLYSWFAALSAFPTLVYGRTDYVWAFSQRVFSTYTSLVAKLAWRTKIVTDLTDVWPEALANTGHARENSFRYRAANFVAEVAYRVSDRIATLTEPMRMLLVKRHGLDCDRVMVVPNSGVAHLPLRPDGHRQLVAVYYGNIGANYDFEPIINLAGSMEGSLQVVLIGSGESLPQVRQWVDERGLTNVEVTGRPMVGDDLWKAVGEADVLLLSMKKGPYPDASFPTKFVEYLSIGRPILYFGDGYPSALISKSGAGLASAAGDLASARAYLESLASRKDLRDTAGRRAEELGEKMFSRDRFAASLNSLFS